MNARRPAAAHFQIFAPRETAPVRWRLLSGNNRELGRGVAEYLDAATCHIAIKELVAGLDELKPEIRRSHVHRWTWELRQHGEPIASSSHLFDRQIRCTQGLSQFLLAALHAVVNADVMVSASRRWVMSPGSDRTAAPIVRRGRSAAP